MTEGEFEFEFALFEKGERIRCFQGVYNLISGFYLL